jgi:hypothetical protein
MEAVMPSNIMQLAVRTAVVTGTFFFAISEIGSALAQSPVAPTQVMGQEGLTNRFESPISETDFRLGDRQQLKGYFFDGSRDRLR